MFTLYPPSVSPAAVEFMTPVSELTGTVKPLVASLHLNHENVKGPTPPGLEALREAEAVPCELQKKNMGSLTAGAEG